MSCSFTNIPHGYITPNGNIVMNDGTYGVITPNKNVIITDPLPTIKNPINTISSVIKSPIREKPGSLLSQINKIKSNYSILDKPESFSSKLKRINKKN